MRSRPVPHGLPGFIAAVLWARCFVAGPAVAAVPAIELWTMDGQYVKTALDRIETNRAYAAGRWLETSCRVVNPPSDGPVQVGDLVLRCVLPAGVAFGFNESGADRGVWFYQWDAAQTSLIARLAGMLTNDTEVRVSPELTTSNAWMWPRVAVSRACDRIQIPALGAITQTCTVVVTVPPSSLAGLTNLEVSLPDWNLPTERVEVSLVTNSFPPQFSEFPSGSLRGYLAADAAALAGTYTFVNTLRVSNKTSQTLQFVPEVETRYAERCASETSGTQMALRQDYGNGMAVVASTPRPATWQGTWTRGMTSLGLLAKCVAAGAPPLLTDIRMVRATTVSANGLTHADLMVSCDGSNLLAGVLTTPGNRRLDMNVEGGSSLYLEPASCNAADLAEFTNGTYRVDLLDATNGTAATYAFALRGAAVTQVPALRTPPGLTTPDARPMISWTKATHANVSSVLLILNNAWFSSDSFNLWPGSEVTNHVPDSDLYAAAPWQVMYADLLVTNAGAANLMSGHLASREGLFNVVSNGFNLATVHLAAGPVSAVAGDSVTLSVPNYGFFTGEAMTFRLLFGDGEEALAASATHAYATNGVYTARVIATDGTGAAATGTVTVTVHPVPLFSSAGRAAGGKIALSFPTVSGAVYRAQFADNLRTPSWGRLAMVTSGTGGTMSVRTSGSVTQRFYRLTCELPGAGGPGPFQPLSFPFRNTGDVVRLAAFGIPDWSGTEPHNGIDLQVNASLASSEILSPTTGTVTRVEASENPFSEPPGQLMVAVEIRAPSGLEVNLVLEPSTVDPALKAAQIAAVRVTEGQEVDAGTPVADLMVGTLGYPHLHYMLMRDGQFACAYGYSTPAAQAAFEAIAARPGNNLPDGNISYGEP